MPRLWHVAQLLPAVGTILALTIATDEAWGITAHPRSLEAVTPEQPRSTSNENALAPPPLGNPPRILPRETDILLDRRDQPACWRPSARGRSVFSGRLVTTLWLGDEGRIREAIDQALADSTEDGLRTD
jgi:hypothetical protein